MTDREATDETADWELLHTFTRDHSQAAFTALMRRHTNLVYGVCRRELRDTALAEDAAQAVFLILAGKAPSLKPARHESTLSSWLFGTALLVSKNARRQEQRRHAREEEAAPLQTELPEQAPEAWADVAPLLNDALRSLSASSRTLILARYFEDRPLAEIGVAHGLSEDAARMRINRALDRLRRYFAAHGVTLSSAALAGLLPLAIRPAPAHAAEALSRLTFPPPAGTPAFTLAQGAIHTMNTHRLRLQLGAAALVAVFVLGTAGAVRISREAKARAAAAATQENQTQALAVLNRMYATYAAMKSFKCHVTSRDDSGAATDGDYEIEYPHKIRFSRFTLIRDLSGQAMAVSDGRNMYTTCTESNGTVHGAVDRYAKQQVRFVGPPNVPQDLSPWFASFGGIGFSYGVEPDAGMPDVALGHRLHSSPYSNPYPQMLPPVYSLGQSVVQDLQGTPGPAPYDVVIARIPYAPGVTNRDWPGAAVIVTYYIGQRDHLLHKLTASDPLSQKDLDTRTETYDSVAVNPKLPASDFVFTPVPGSHEVRDTNDLFPSGSRG